jgi:hypothetical protein
MHKSNHADNAYAVCCALLSLVQPSSTRSRAAACNCLSKSSGTPPRDAHSANSAPTQAQQRSSTKRMVRARAPKGLVFQTVGTPYAHMFKSFAVAPIIKEGAPQLLQIR